MAGSLRSGFKRNKKGHGHGLRNHRHASGNGIAWYYYGLYQRELRREAARKFEMFGSVREAFEKSKRRLIALCSFWLVFGMCPPAWAAGTCVISNVTSTQNANSRVPDAQTVIVTLTCVGDGSTGSFPTTAIPISGASPPGTLLNAYNLTGFMLYQVGRTPGTTAPTVNYSVTVTDAKGYALDGGLLTSNGSATGSQLTAITTSATLYPVVRSALTVAITGNSVNSAGITLDLIFRTTGPGSASGGGGPPTGAAGGALSGTYPNPSLANLTMAASNSTSQQKAQANVVCSGTNDQNCINAVTTSACPASTGTNVVGCTLTLMDGVFKLSGSVVQHTDGWNLVGVNHTMWGGFSGAWFGQQGITAGSCSANVCTFTVGSAQSTSRDLTLLSFSGTGASTLNNFSGSPSSSTSSSFTITIPGAGTIASTGSGTFTLAAGAIGTGGAQLRATASGFPLISVVHDQPCGTGTDTNRCRGWMVKNIYGVCYGYGQNFLDAPITTEDNIRLESNVIQRCVHGVTGSFDSPTFLDNSFQDNSGDFFHGTLVNIGAYNNLIFDNGGYAYNFTGSGSGGIIADRAWGDLAGGLVANAMSFLSVGGFSARYASTSHPVISFTSGTNNSVHDMNMTLNGASNTTCVQFVGATGGQVTGNGCNIGVGNSTIANDLFSIDGNSVSVTGNSITGNTQTVQANSYQALAINAVTCTSCTVVSNPAPGLWNFGGPPILGGAGSQIGLNATTTLAGNGIAAITSASLLERLQATNATPAVNGSTITAWPDSSGNSAAVQGFVGTPTYTLLGINGAPGITFNGSSGVFSALPTAASAASTSGQERIYWVIFRQTTSSSTSGTTQNIFSDGQGVRNIYIPTSNVLCVFGNSGGNFCSSITPTVSVGHVLEVVMNGASSRMVLDGTSVATFSQSDSATYSGYSIGINGTTNNQPFFGVISELAGYNGGSAATYTSADARTLGAAYCSAFIVTCGTSW